MINASSEPDVDDRGRLGRNLTHGLLESLGRAIVTGRFEQGFPTEAELARRHGVSRSVTREAVKMLTAKGLVSARPRQGTTIRPATSWNLFDPDVLRWLLERRFSIELLRHFSELRMGVEPEAAALAARCGDEADHRGVVAGLDRMKAAERGEDDTLEADIAFHVAVLRASKNPFYAQFRDMVATALATSIRFTNRIQGHSASIPEHEAVCDAVLARDAEGARAAMRTLIGNAIGLLDRAGDERPSPPWD